MKSECLKNELPVIIHLEKRNEVVTIMSGREGLVYTVKTLHETRAIEILREVHRVLRCRGKVVILDWVEGKMAWTRERYFSTGDLEEMVKETGFRLSGLEVLDDVMLLTTEK